MQIQETAGTFDIRRFGAPRSPGHHVTPILKEVAIKLRVMEPTDEDEDLDLLLLKYPDFQTGDIGVFNRIVLGLAWEDWIWRHVPHCHYHFGEVSRDGIVGTPDGLIIPPDWMVRLYESKVTWKSANQERRPIRKEWLWIKQLQCYCAMVRLLEADLHVMYVNGNYKGSGPLYAIYHFTFTEEEIEGAWRLLSNNRNLVQIAA